MSRPSWTAFRPPDGFTLIEVIGALVIFSVGVLMVIQLSGGLGIQMRYAGAASELAVLTNVKLDSLEPLPIGSIAAGTVLDTIIVAGAAYERRVVVTSWTPVLSKIEVTIAPVGGIGPSYSVTSYKSGTW